MADHFHNRQIPFGFNQFSETEDPRREDFDIYTGQPHNPLLWEIKMDWLSAITGNLFVEEKTLNNTKAHKIAYGRLFIDVFDTDRLRQMYEAFDHGVYKYRHVIGGDQANNRGMLLGWKDCKDNSKPFWLAVKELTQRE